MDNMLLRTYLIQNTTALFLIGIFITLAVVLYISQAPLLTPPRACIKHEPV
jgi:hypothetical protein